MEIIIQMAISAIGLILLVFLLPVPWSLFGKGVIWFASILLGGLFIISWEIQPRLQTILLHIGLLLTMCALIIKWWGEHFYKKTIQQKKQVSHSPRPLFSYQKQIEKAKLAKPADIVEPAVLSSLNVFDGQLVIHAEEQNESAVNKASGSVTEEELQFLLPEIHNKHEFPSFSQDQSLIEDEPGYLLDDWIISDDKNISSVNVYEKEPAVEIEQENAELEAVWNVISFDKKRKEREKPAPVLTDLAEIELDIDVNTGTDNLVQKNDIEWPPFNEIDNLIETEPMFNEEIERIALHLPSSLEDIQMEPAEELEDEDLESPYTGRSILLNDGISNLYKERAESVKRQKTKEENRQPLLQNEKQFLKELTNRFRASSE
ncbi:hypothetical protein SAMN05877753_105282 [Bacillus oleivorans]|uniref:Uncharacterized protein n=1 Tax=Bacillus oleivorans TaxID=1448271 RepID=A0A285CVE0_9BACI|nr:hypothetical protein [Bacillus oleivorans]SNX71530.1 hypothetical protein SAMN05877753_105282 [Bacillus oleivorans]